MTQSLPSARIIAYSATNRNINKTVNITTVQNPDKTEPFEQYTQETAVQAAAQPNVFPTFMAASAPTAGLKTIYIPGYTAPN